MSEELKEISIILDVWDDIFSDFDPRPLDQRALSEDFLIELKKRYRETPTGDLLISFYAPKALQDEKSEKMVIHRLKQYFKYRALLKKRDRLQMRALGAIFALAGICFLGSITLIAYFNIVQILYLRLLEIICVPLGWFGIWEGFSKIVNSSPKFSQDETLYRKLSTADYQFHYGA